MVKVALITGASQGIGKAIAVRLAQDGFLVALNDLPSRKDALEQLQAELATTVTESKIYLADVTLEDEVHNMILDVVKTMGSLDVMVANAGICIQPLKPITEVTVDEFQRTMSVNVLGVFLCYKYAAQEMIKQGKGGRMIAASSIAGKRGSPFITAYGASKFAVRGMTQTAASELGKYGITVNAYAPGFVDTPMGRAFPNFDEVSKRSPIGRDGTPEEVAALVSYLVSDAASMVTGQSISINGGLFFD